MIRGRDHDNVSKPHSKRSLAHPALDPEPCLGHGLGRVRVRRVQGQGYIVRRPAISYVMPWHACF